MANRKNIASGVWPTMITPYTEDGKIDFNGVKEILDFYEKNKVDGVFAVCQSSEMFFLSLEERVELAQFVSEHLPEHMDLVISGHVADDVETQIEEAKQMMTDRVSAYVILPNRFAAENESDDVLLSRMEQFMEGFPDVPLGIYECPHPYKRLASPKILEWCLKTDRFMFLKDTSCDMDNIKEKLNILEGTGFKFFNANSATILPSLRLGGDGFSGVMGNFHPELYHEMIVADKDSPKTAELLQDFLGVASLIERQRYPVNAKYYLTLCGLDITLYSRSRNWKEFSKSERAETEQLYRMAEYMKKQILK